MTDKAGNSVLPCVAPCPKCGSTDIWRNFFSKGDQIKNEEYCRSPCKWITESSYHYFATRDLIKHHCRCCQFDWVTTPLPNKPKRRDGGQVA